MRHPDLMTFALRGAELRLKEMDAERAEIFHTFPGLAKRESRQSTVTPAPEMADDRPPKKSRRKRTLAERKAISKRMKAYWAGQR